MGLVNYIKHICTYQKGAVSPFLFGMLAGIAVLSGGVKFQADLEMKRIQEQQQERAAETADTYRRAVESALMAETTGTFGTIDATDINSFVAKSIGGGTRSGQNIAMGTITTDATTNAQQIIISTSDDNFVRTQITALETGADAALMAADTANNRSDVVSIDTSTIRTQQVAATLSRMERQSEVLMSFWGRNGRFPSLVEYAPIQAQTPVTDFWGGAITYTFTSDNIAQLQTTTPWAQVLTVPLNMDTVVPLIPPCTALGDITQGGFCLGSGVGALVAALADEATTPIFSSEVTVTGATSLIDGEANTSIYVGLGEANYPAPAICYNLVMSGFDDWYLPSKNELDSLYLNRAAIGGFNTSVGIWYWTSTEFSDSNVTGQKFSDGTFDSLVKNYGLDRRIRCVRKTD